MNMSDERIEKLRKVESSRNMSTALEIRRRFDEQRRQAMREAAKVGRAGGAGYIVRDAQFALDELREILEDRIRTRGVLVSEEAAFGSVEEFKKFEEEISTTVKVKVLAFREQLERLSRAAGNTEYLKHVPRFERDALRLQDEMVSKAKELAASFEAGLLPGRKAEPTSIQQTVFGNVGNVVAGNYTEITVLSVLTSIEKQIEESDEIPAEEKASLLEKIRSVIRNPFVTAVASSSIVEFLKKAVP